MRNSVYFILEREIASMSNIRQYFLLLIALTLFVNACSGQNSQVTVTERGQDETPGIVATIPQTLSPSPTPTGFEVKGTVRIWHSLDETQIPALAQIQSDFNFQYPDVLFDVLYIPSADLRPRYEVETRQGSGPTLLMGPGVWGPELFDENVIADLNGLIEEDLEIGLNQPALGAVQYKGSLIGLPFAIQGVVLYRNKDIITIEATTFDELVSLGQSSTFGEDVGAILERSFFYSGAHLNGIGGNLMDEDGLPAFNNVQGINWLQLLRDFEDVGPTNYLTDEDLERFMSGNIGWIIDGTWNLDQLAESIGPENLAIDVWPTYQSGTLSGYVRAENVYLNPQLNEDDLVANLKFVEFLLSPESGVRLAEAGYIPAARDTQMEDPVKGPLITQAMAALANGTTYPVTPLMEIYNVNMDIALRSYFEDGLSASNVLQTAQEAIIAEIAAMQVTETPVP